MLLALAAGAVFAPTLGADFTYDDANIVVDNPAIRSWHFFDVWGGWKRNVRLFSLMLDYHLYGYEPAGYHATNILLHVAAVLLYFLLLRRISQRPLLSFAAALLFALHPIHVEAVANITNRKEMLCAVFSVASFLAFVRGSGEPRRVAWLAASVALWIPALYSKQVALVLPLSMAAYEFLFLPARRRILLSPWVVVSGAVLVTLVVLRATSHLDFDRPASIPTLAGYEGDPTFFNVALTSARAFWMYVGLLSWPVDLCPDYLVELSTSLLEPATLLSWLALAGLGVSSALAARRAPLAVFGLWWLLIHYLPVSNLLPSVFILADRYMYIPSMGFCLLLACVGDAVARRLESRGAAPARPVVAGCALLLAIFYGVRTLQYDQHWLTSRSIWDYTVRCNPRSFRAHNGLALDAMAARQYESAIVHYTRALEFKPGFSQAYNNRAICHGQMGRLEEAAADFAAAIRVDPDNADAHFNLGYLHAMRREADAARASYTRAQQLGHPAASAALGALAAPPEG